MRLSPRSIFLGVVVIGLPFAVLIGWAVGNPATTPTTPMPEGAGGAGGFGTAPTLVISPSADLLADSWTRTSPRPVSADTPVQSRPPRSRARARPSITATAVPDPTLTVPPRVLPPLPTPGVIVPPTDPATTVTPESTTGLLPGWR